MVKETREAILRQLILATHASAEKPVKEAMTASGVKYSFAISIINDLIAAGKVLRKSTPTQKVLSAEVVNQLLTEEIKKYKDSPVMNPLLEMPGT